MKQKMKQTCSDYLLLSYLSYAEKIAMREEHCFSEEFEQRMEPLLCVQSGSRLCRRRLGIWKTIAIAVTIAVLLAGTTAAAFELRHFLPKLFFHQSSDMTVMQFAEEVPPVSGADAMPVTMPKWLPEGYALQNETVQECWTEYFYENEAGETIRFRRYFASVTISAEFIGEQNANLTIHGAQAYFGALENGNSLYWTDNVYVYTLFGNNSQEQLVKIAESVQ